MAELKLSQLCELLTEKGVPARRDGEDCIVRAVNTLEDAGEGEISFLANPKYEDALRTSNATAVIVGDAATVPDHISAVRCADPYVAVALTVVAIHGFRKHPQWGVSERAVIDPSARLGNGCHLAAGVSIAAGVTIGDNCVFYPGCYIADGAKIGDDCVLFPNVVVYDHCVLGDRVTIHAGSVIGEDGLGFAPVGDKWLKIPQVGHVVVGDDVEIGANCTIDRATLGTTEIGSGTKFGNVVVIGHGSKIGTDCLFVGLVGMAGSVTVGHHVTLGGQVGVRGHVDIGRGAQVAGQSGITSNIEPGMKVFGLPARKKEDAMRSMFAVQKLPAMFKRIRALEREIRELRSRADSE